MVEGKHFNYNREKGLIVSKLRRRIQLTVRAVNNYSI